MTFRRPLGRSAVIASAISFGLMAAAVQDVAAVSPAHWHKPPKPDAGHSVRVTHWTPPATPARARPASWQANQAEQPAPTTYSLPLTSAVGTASSGAPTWTPLGSSGIAAQAVTSGQPYAGHAATGQAGARTRTSSQPVSISVLSAAERTARGLTGLAVRLGARQAALRLRIPAALTDNLYGADYADRIRWVELPDTGTGPATAVPASAISRDNSGNTIITAPLATQGMVLAATSTPVSSAGSGTWAATDLKPAAQWGVSQQTGSFIWSYPMATPPAAAGPAPNLSLSYDSGSVDGETGSTNNQPSALGEGWSLTGGGYVERRYVSCSEDDGATGPVTTSGDLCWKSDNGVLSFGGHSGTLVKDASPGEWRLEGDDGTIVKELTGCASGTTRGDCWEAVTTDGTQYYFGKNQLPGYTSPTATPPTQSVWTVPVYGNDPGEPGYNGAGGTAKGTFATEATTEAWRWNLDYVVDPHGNAEALYYTPETNQYAQNGSGGTQYVRGGQLARIDYGMPASAVYTAGGPADRVSFSYAERCKTGSTCSSSTPTTMPDVPWDQNCTASPCTGKVSPTFWSEKMLTTVTSQVRTSATGYSTVNSWALQHDYPATNDTANPPALWLSQVQQTGYTSGSGTTGATSIALPATVFKPTSSGMDNRVWVADGLTRLAKFRITEIDTSIGGIDTIAYSAVDPACTYSYGQTTLNNSPDTDTHRCFLQWWTPQVTPPQPAQPDLFNKYVVQSVVENPHTGGSYDLPTETDYSYGTPAWRYDNSPFLSTKYRGWSVFAGFSTVEVRQGNSGSPATQQVTDYTYYQGMNGDHLANGGTRTAYVTSSDGTQVPDSRWLRGQLREAIMPDPAGGSTPLSDELLTPWASSVNADDGTLQARIVGDGDTVTTTPVSTGGTRAVAVHTTHDDNTGLVRTVSDDSTDAGSTCTRTDYAQNTAAWLMDYPSEVSEVGVPCGSTPSYPGDGISDVRTSYDGLGWGTAPIRGDATTVQKVIGYTGSTAATATWLTTASATYDSLGRVLQGTDQLGRQNKVAYNPDANGNSTTSQPLTAETSTTDAQSGGLQWVTKSAVNPAWGVQLSVTDQNNEVTAASYDALGRRTQVWLANRPQASYPSSPSISYGYTVSLTAPLAVATTTLTPSGTTIASYALYDGLDRPRQTQSWGEGKNTAGSHITAGTVVTDTLYDSAGRIYETAPAYSAINSTPSPALIVPATTVPGQVQTTYDTAGRKTADIQLVNGAQVWSTGYSYQGADRTDTTPPNGGTPTSTFVDERGRTTALWQYDASSVSGTPLVTSYGYDTRGDLTGMTDATRQNSWSWQYDVLGRLVQSVDPDTGTTDTGYDNADRITSVTSGARLVTGTQSAARVTIAYSYDDADRRTGEYLGSLSGTKLAGWTYDTLMKGQLTSSTSYAGSDAFTEAVTSYDPLYRPKGTSTTIPADPTVTGSLAGTYNHTLSYNPDGSLTSITDQSMGGLPFETLKTHYTALGNPYSYTGYSAYLSDDSFTNINQVSQELITDGNSELQRTFYYATGTNRLSRLLTTTSASTNFTPADNNYTYDDNGNLTSDTTHSDSGTTTQCFGYDHLVELTAAWTPASNDCTTQPTSASSIGGLAPYWTSYGYDNATGNRTSVIDHDLTGGSDTTAQYGYPAAGAAQPHVLTGITYQGGRTGSDSFTSDPAGETIQRPGQALTYTPEGRLGTVTVNQQTQTEIYDADGNLLLTDDPAAGNTLYLDDTELHTPAGSPSDTPTAVRTYSVLGTPVAERSTSAGGPANGALVWLNADRNNTVTEEFDHLTLAATVRHFDPFGNAVGTAATWTSPHSYLNGATNGTAGTVHLGAREYDPTQGRFLTRDPIFDPADPVQDNGYSYSRNDPVSTSDPTGLHQECEGGCHGSDLSAGAAAPTGVLGTGVISTSRGGGTTGHSNRGSSGCWGPGGEYTCSGPNGGRTSSNLDNFFHSYLAGLGAMPANRGPLSLNMIRNDPNSIRGLNPDELMKQLAGKLPKDVRIGPAKSKSLGDGPGWKLIIERDGNLTIRWSPGSLLPGHSRTPYWKVSGGQLPGTKVVEAGTWDDRPEEYRAPPLPSLGDEPDTPTGPVDDGPCACGGGPRIGGGGGRVLDEEDPVGPGQLLDDIIDP